MTKMRSFISFICLLAISFHVLLSSTSGAVVKASGTGIGDSRPAFGHTIRMQPSQSLSKSEDDTHFVADSGGDLDQYLFRDDRPDGLIKFNIQIKRYFFNEADTNNIKFDNGFLTANAVDYAISKKILPSTLKLRLRVFDVDEEAAWCPEKDLVSINGQPIILNGRQVQLSGANDIWSERSFDVPIRLIKFPQHKGTYSSPAPADNEISIRVDSNNCVSSTGNPAWAVQIEYGVLEVTGAMRPVVFAHGWTGNTSTFNKINDRLLADGIPSAGHADLLQGIYPISQTAGKLNEYIRNVAREYGVDKVNLFAHSKGGLVARRSLYDAEIAKQVEHLITFDTPNHGTLWAEDDVAMSGVCLSKYPLNPTQASLCYQASKELTENSVRNTFNYRDCTYNLFSGWQNCQPIYIQQPSVEYRAFAATWDLVVFPDASAGFPWNDDHRPTSNSLHVDAQYATSHGGILDRTDSYQCAIHLMDYARYNCPITNSSNSIKEQIALSGLIANQPIFSKTGSLIEPGQYSANVSVDPNTQLQMEVYSASQVNFSLREPGGRLIDPDVVAGDSNLEYSFDTDLGLYHFSYVIDNPIPGNWETIVQSTTPATFTILAKVASPISIEVTTSKSSYLPGQTITIQAALMQSGLIVTGGTVTGKFEQPDSTFIPISFYDDMTHGDTTALDGIYTAQVTAPDTQASLYLNTVATKGLTRREKSTLIPVSNQTAVITNVTGEWTIDDDGDGYIDWLNIQVNIKVLQSGFFDLQGSLADSTNAILLSTQYQSHSHSTTPLNLGDNSIVLKFNGENLWAKGKEGPYKLTNLLLEDTTGQIYPIDLANDIYTTANYTRSQFAHAPIWLESITESAVDQDGNGRYDALVFHPQIGIENLGDYEINGRLLDKDGNEIMWNQANFSVSAAGLQNVDLSFDGAKIGQLQANGPYALVDVSITNPISGPTLYLGSVMMTSTHNFTEFEEGFYRTYIPTLLKYLNLVQGIQPTLSSPANEITLNTLIPTFSWSMGIQPAGSTGCFAISQTPGSTSCMMTFGAAYSSTRTTVMWYNLQPEKVYYWRVGVKTSGQADYLWSNQWSFKTAPLGGPIPATPQLTAPINDTIVSTSSLTLYWQPVSGALGYDVSVHNITKNNYYGFTVNGNVGQVTLSGFLEAGTTYEWSVAARNDYAWGADSASWKFTTTTMISSPSLGKELPNFRFDDSDHPVYLDY
jgi:pimeloyl-ACP methyl ester carboxylesterase